MLMHRTTAAAPNRRRTIRTDRMTFTGSAWARPPPCTAVVSQKTNRDGHRPIEESTAMAFSVQMPALGESVTEGTVTRWLKQEGDTVEADEPLLEVSTDKVDTEIPAPVSGVLTKIIAGEDDTVEVGGELDR